MAIKFVNNVDFVFYNTKGLAIENLATAPSTTVEGAMYYNKVIINYTTETIQVGCH